MVKYVRMLRLGTAETEAMLRRFTRNNVQHLPQKAFEELGKAVEIIFLCRYLHSEEPSREILDRLNVIEPRNGAHDLVFFARRGELTSNRHEDHEACTLALHLLQTCMFCINMLMLQIDPSIWKHVNPYGRFELNMDDRIPLA